MNDRETKIHDLIRSLAASPDGLGVLHRGLAAAGLMAFRDVASMNFAEVRDPVRVANAKNGILLDTETTGVDTAKDRVIQLAMRKMKYDDQGIISLGEVFDRFNDPGIPIPIEVTRLTRITDDDVRGQRITSQEVRDFIGQPDMVLCHNAGFDRKMVEREFKGAGFESLRFDCTFAQVEWILRGNSGRTLELLALQAGYVYGSHNALNDINVMPYVLGKDHPEMGTPFAEMVAKGGGAQILLIAENSHYDSKDTLKDRGYRWSADGVDAAGYKAWFKVLPDDPETLALEAEFMRDQIYRRDVALPAYRIDGTERYSARRPANKIPFRTAEITSLRDVLDQRPPVREEQAGFSF